MEILIIQSFIVALAAGGLALCVYIHSTKRKGRRLICPLDGSCDFVVRSEYGIMFGLDVDMLGMLYYTAIALIFSATIFLQPPFYSYAILAGTALSTAGFFMSIYFLWLQFAVIKRWCSLCVGSAVISIMIFVLAILGSWPAAISLFGI